MRWILAITTLVLLTSAAWAGPGIGISIGGGGCNGPSVTISVGGNRGGYWCGAHNRYCSHQPYYRNRGYYNQGYYNQGYYNQGYYNQGYYDPRCDNRNYNSRGRHGRQPGCNNPPYYCQQHRMYCTHY